MRYVLLALALLLGACSSTARNDAAVLEVGLTAAGDTALAYIQLPDCSTPNAPKLCSKAAIRVNIGKAWSVAYIAVKNAETAAQTLNANPTVVQQALAAAQAALATFQAAVSQLPKS